MILNVKISSHYIIFLWLTIILCAVLYLVNSLHMQSNISFFLPEDSGSDKAFLDRVMKHQLTEGEAGKIILIAIKEKQASLSSASQIIASKQLAEANIKLTAKLKTNKQFISVQNGQFTLSDLIIEPYFHYRYLLQTKPPANFSSESLKHTFQQLLERLQLIPSSIEQKLFAEDPQMLWLSFLKQWQTQKLQKHYGVWFDQSGKQSLLFIKTRAAAYDLQQQKENIETVELTLQQLINNNPALTYTLTGAPIFALESKKSISTQIKTISVLASILLMIFLYWFFRSLKIIFLIGLPLACAILTGMTIVMLFDGFIHGITIAFGITIIGIAVDYPVHFYSHIIFSSPTHKEKISQQTVILSIWPLLRLGLITTLIGFSAITLSDFSGLRQLGLFAMSGLLAAALVTRYILPIIPIRTYQQTHAKNNAFTVLLSLANYPLSKIIFQLSIILPVLALFYIASQHSILWQNDLSAMSPVPQKQKQQDFELRKAMGLPELRYALILQAVTIEQVLQNSESLKVHLDELKAQEFISGYDMANLYLPSIKFQQAQQLTLPTENELKTRLNKILKNTPLSVDAFLPFIDSIKVSKQMQPLLAKSILTAQTGNNKSDFITDKIKVLLFESRMNQKTDAMHTKLSSSNNWTALIPLQGVLHDFPIHKLQQNSNFAIHLLDLKTQTETMLSNYRNEALVLFSLGAILILAVLFSQHRKWSHLFFMAWPFIGAVLLTVASLLLMGYSLSIFHLVTLLLVIGLGIDYSIFMHAPTQTIIKEDINMTQSTEVSQVSVIICLISTLIMFGALSLSDLPVLKSIGLTASLGALYAFLLARASLSNAHHS